MPIDITRLRDEAEAARIRDMTVKRFKPAELVDKTIDLDQQWRKAQFQMEQEKKALGVIQKEIAGKMKAKENADAEKAQKLAVEAKIAELEKTAEDLRAARDKALNEIPNDLDPTVPVSNNEDDNGLVKQWGECRASTPDLLHHHELLWMIDGYEPEKGVGVAGHRAYFLKGPGLRLNQAVINYGLDTLGKGGYTPIQPPYFMNRDIMAGVAQLSDFDEQLYKVQGESEDSEKYLIATSEQPICALHKGDWIAEKDLPKKYAGYSSCFRKEAGSHGRDAWGIFRVHQFEKVEQFVITTPEDSAAAQEEMISKAEHFYQTLGLPYRVVNICSGELNNAAAKKYDLEAWFPTLAVYRELVSCSNCTDYQSRAMEVRCGSTAKPTGAKRYCHFLNSTLCATTRTICCILENYQTPEGVNVPAALVPYMGGQTFIPFTREKPVNKDAAKKEKAAAGGAAATAPAPSPKPAAAPAPAAAAPAPAPAKRLATATAAALPVPVMSASVLGIVGKPALTATAGLSALETALKTRSYIAGYTPSCEDEVCYTALCKAGLNEGSAGLKTYPNISRWSAHMKSYTADERAAWPLTHAQLLSGAVDARQSQLFTL